MSLKCLSSMSESGDPETTIIDAQGLGSVISAPSRTDVRVEGFTITGGGSVDYGGGVFGHYTTDLVLTNCIIRNNRGGVAAYQGANMVFHNCDIINNEHFQSGAFHIPVNSSVTLYGCTVRDNIATGLEGNRVTGGIYIFGGSTFTAYDSIIENNFAEGQPSDAIVSNRYGCAIVELYDSCIMYDYWLNEASCPFTIVGDDCVVSKELVTWGQLKAVFR
jgi:hypothetical protein